MSAAENKELIRNMFADLSKGNGQAFLDTLADTVRFTTIGTTKFSGTFNGKQEWVNKALMPAVAQLDGGITITPDNFIAEGDYVVTQRVAIHASNRAATTTIPIVTSSVSPMEKCRRLPNTLIVNS